MALSLTSSSVEGRAGGFFVPAARAPTVLVRAFFDWEIGGRGQTPHDLALFFI
jgi:hypothetical protein